MEIDVAAITLHGAQGAAHAHEPLIRVGDPLAVEQLPGGEDLRGRFVRVAHHPIDGVEETGAVAG